MADETKVALVTGASAGIGRSCADRLADAGWVVVGASRRGSAGAAWEGLIMDVDDDVSVQQGVSLYEGGPVVKYRTPFSL